MHIHAQCLKPFAPAQIGQVNHERTAEDFSAQPFDQLDRGLGCAARCKKIVDNHNGFAGMDRIFVDFNNRVAVFQCIFLSDHRAGQFAFLEHGKEADD